MALTISIQVPVDDASALDELLQQVEPAGPTTTIHPFDGEEVVQAIVLLTGTGLPVLRTWLRARVDTRKSFRVVYDGTEFEGYTADEVETLVRTLAADADGE